MAARLGRPHVALAAARRARRRRAAVVLRAHAAAASSAGARPVAHAARHRRAAARARDARRAGLAQLPARCALLRRALRVHASGRAAAAVDVAHRRFDLRRPRRDPLRRLRHARRRVDARAHAAPGHDPGRRDGLRDGRRRLLRTRAARDPRAALRAPVAGGGELDRRGGGAHRRGAARAEPRAARVVARRLDARAAAGRERGRAARLGPRAPHRRGPARTRRRRLDAVLPRSARPRRRDLREAADLARQALGGRRWWCSVVIAVSTARASLVIMAIAAAVIWLGDPVQRPV